MLIPFHLPTQAVSLCTTEQEGWSWEATGSIGSAQDTDTHAWVTNDQWGTSGKAGAACVYLPCTTAKSYRSHVLLCSSCTSDAASENTPPDQWGSGSVTRDPKTGGELCPCPSTHRVIWGHCHGLPIHGVVSLGIARSQKPVERTAGLGPLRWSGCPSIGTHRVPMLEPRRPSVVLSHPHGSPSQTPWKSWQHGGHHHCVRAGFQPVVAHGQWGHESQYDIPLCISKRLPTGLGSCCSGMGTCIEVQLLTHPLPEGSRMFKAHVDEALNAMG